MISVFNCSADVQSLDKLVGMLEAAAAMRDIYRGPLLYHYRWEDLTTLTVSQVHIATDKHM